MKHTPSGTSDAKYKLVTPPDLTDAQDSVFSPEAAANRLSQRQQMERTASELKELGHFLTLAALPALFPEQDLTAEAHGAGDDDEGHSHAGGRKYTSRTASVAAMRRDAHVVSGQEAGHSDHPEAGVKHAGVAGLSVVTETHGEDSTGPNLAHDAGATQLILLVKILVEMHASCMRC